MYLACIFYVSSMYLYFYENACITDIYPLKDVSFFNLSCNLMKYNAKYGMQIGK